MFVTPPGVVSSGGTIVKEPAGRDWKIAAPESMKTLRL
jgi:hypothetical protein